MKGRHVGRQGEHAPVGLLTILRVVSVVFAGFILAYVTVLAQGCAAW